ncbi:MAG: histidine--tRNA ligase [Eubacterium sp.]|nr:histidine--tRNA ligase [Eubacterium sp.]
MDIVTKRPRGTEDKLPKEIYKWHTLEKVARDTAEAYGCKEIRTPTFEHTELFQRGVGGTTDVVQKEMYTFEDKKGRSITLKPEGTAGAVRAAIENGLFNDALPLKTYYFTRCFRYETPQSGRLREFNQFGIEVFGAASPSSDVEVIALANDVITRLGVKNISLEINSIGCPACRAEYHKALKAYYEQYKDKLCDTCLERLDRNPMRLLDCKSEICSGFKDNAPLILDYLCDDCKDHFDGVKKRLDALEIKYTVNPLIVRGLDYYTNTVFEFISNEIGSQGAVCAGGRYNGLVEEIGGSLQPGLGFAMGLERMIMVMDNQQLEYEPEKKCDLYIASFDEETNIYAMTLANRLRAEGFWAEFDTAGRSFKAQMKYANKINAAYCMVIGSDELAAKSAKLKRMSDGEEIAVKLDDSFAQKLNTLIMDISL